MTNPSASGSSRERLSLLFLVSGFAALIYQVVWQRALFTAFGVNIETITVIEEKTAQLPSVEAVTKQVRTEVAQFEKDYDERLAKFAAERDKAAEELKGVDAQLPEDIMATYRKLVSVKGADSLAQIENRNCTACYTDLIPQNVMELNRGAFVICKSCGRMLYV